MAECFRIVRPILLRRKLPCLFFVSTDFLDNAVMFYRHKVSLCIDRLNEASFEQRRRVLQECGRSGFDEFVSWIKRLRLSDEARIDGICELCGVDVTNFLTTRRPYMTQAQVQQLCADGFAIGAHTRRHPYLAELDSPQEIREEIVQSCRFVRELTGAERVPFAFPFSGDGVERALLRSILADYRFIGPFFDTHGIMPTEPFIYNRILADEPHLGAEALIRKAYGAEAGRLLRKRTSSQPAW